MSANLNPVADPGFGGRVGVIVIAGVGMGGVSTSEGGRKIQIRCLDVF